MPVNGDVTQWLRRLQQGDREAVQQLWDAYYRRLMGLARAKLGRLSQRMADKEDVALSAFASFCRGAELDRFPRLENRDDLWQVLGMITARKAADLHQYLGRKKRVPVSGQVRAIWKRLLKEEE
jgi:DNA-directed RNA polymerase specialized sigma24 family protein